MITPEQIDSALNDRILRNEKSLMRAIRKLENRIIILLEQIYTNKNGKIVGVSTSLAQAKSVLKQTRKAFADIYMKEIDSILGGYTDIDSIVLDYAGIEVYQGVTETTLKAQMSLDRSYHESLSEQTQDNLSAIFFDHTINGKSKEDLINSIRGAVTGSVDTLGRSMAGHSSTIAQDGLMQYYRTANDKALPKRKDDKFKYFGSLIDDSRQWCIDIKGKVHTREEIAGFDNDSWAGKKSGSTMVVCGGYNCRHYWLRIID